MKEERTARGIKRCSEWLKFCLQLGWDKKSLDGLEELWWKHHDANGNLIRTHEKEATLEQESNR